MTLLGRKKMVLIDDDLSIKLSNDRALRHDLSAAWQSITYIIDVLHDILQLESDVEQTALAVGKYKISRSIKRNRANQIERAYQIIDDEYGEIASITFRDNAYVQGNIKNDKMNILKEAISALKNTARQEIKLSNIKMSSQLQNLKQISVSDLNQA